MKYIIEDALARSASDEKSESPQQSYSIDTELEEVLKTLQTNIIVVGCGGAGSNTVTRMMEEGIEGAELIAINTDAQHLRGTIADRKILIGKERTRGLGAGSLPQIGEEAALESQEELRASVAGADMVFITAGLGGGTGTGAAPVVAEAARDAGALTIAIVTLPFGVEGMVRRANAEAGLDRLLEVVPRLPLQAAFKVSDEVLMRAVKGITELITKPGLINLDFADVRTVMQRGGVAMIGLGESDAEDKAVDSVKKALRSPLLDVDISGATSAIVNVIGGTDMTVTEAEGVVQEVYERIDPDARIIWGAQIDPELDHMVRTLLIVTGVKSPQIYGKSEALKLKTGAQKYGIDFVK